LNERVPVTSISSNPVSLPVARAEIDHEYSI
jgi:hypothetical protein